MEELKTIKQTLEEMKKFLNNDGTAVHIKDSQEFGKSIIKVLESLHFKVEVLEREIGHSNAFITADDIPHRLR
jgi:uncharacterized FlaG/YvyC family protein